MMKYLGVLCLYCTLLLTYPLCADDSQKGFLVLEETLFSGLGAEFSAVVGALDAYEKEEYTGLEVSLTKGLYLDLDRGSNWWNYYFEPMLLGHKESSRSHSSSVEESIALSQKAYNDLSRERCFELINKYIRLQPEIKGAVDDFVEQNFKDQYVIGIHHRGTDKKMEVTLVSWNLNLGVLKSTISQLPYKYRKRYRIYVATDDQYFLDYLRKEFPGKVIAGDFARSTNDIALHAYESLYYANNYEKGREALVEALILSRCQALIRPAPSGYSWIPMVFNPQLPVNSINSHRWVFPGKFSPRLL